MWRLFSPADSGSAGRQPGPAGDAAVHGMPVIYDRVVHDISGIEAARQTLANARAALLAQRGPEGHWTGHLSSSALSTSTAVIALWSWCRAGRSLQEIVAPDRLCADGLVWLAAHQNADGGWGDTPASRSNISTTTLAWAAWKACGHLAPGGRTVERAEGWLTDTAGSLEPATLARAIAARYGRDRTFSVPILTACVLTGSFGSEGWRLVPQLPFELAVVPHQWYGRLRLPVVSYALPALIAMGQVRHHHRPTRNPLTRILRRASVPHTLRLLGRSQPESGGFLEAVPLTSFVVMSLIGAGQVDHPVVSAGLRFLDRGVRADGSWPIDSNLATWVTTLSINALACDGAWPELLASSERTRLRDWLVDQQGHTEHPYTHAAPGGWAWTDLSGGVPDADDTAGTLLALHALDVVDLRAMKAAESGVTWLLNLQNGDGGIPTFCRGWGTLPFDRSGTDLTAHALVAWAAWRDRLPRIASRIDQATVRAVDFLQRTQCHDGAWAPLWFGNENLAEVENLTYGTSRVVLALSDLRRREHQRAAPLVARGMRWLLAAQNADGGWGGGPGAGSSIEETALAVRALTGAQHGSTAASAQESLARGVAWLVRATDGGRKFPATPIGFYFANLWYSEALYPVIFTCAALGDIHGTISARASP
jgi:squalene-hopene/tetraprenyl-beta-curcumene cyclase